ncbi:homeobox protein Hox-D4 isoform X3 [Poecile atricapillus]|uniref:homeobox protein Hox-D4 isoform X3 n=1 Tax=Poecile atricapillus TaxID=48891 RepID=UPI0027398EE0|nr:homeobox protein Hox-D4 isoform X3 [Poecile atricapillus]
MAVSLMFVPRSPKPAAGPGAAALTLPRPRAASSPAPTEGCADTRARCLAACSPSLFSHRSMPRYLLRHTDCYASAKWITATLPGLLRRRAMPRTGFTTNSSLPSSVKRGL